MAPGARCTRAIGVGARDGSKSLRAHRALGAGVSGAVTVSAPRWRRIIETWTTMLLLVLHAAPGVLRATALSVDMLCSTCTVRVARRQHGYRAFCGIMSLHEDEGDACGPSAWRVNARENVAVRTRLTAYAMTINKGALQVSLQLFRLQLRNSTSFWSRRTPVHVQCPQLKLMRG